MCCVVQHQGEGPGQGGKREKHNGCSLKPQETSHYDGLAGATRLGVRSSIVAGDQERLVFRRVE
jgi:hypothetical protein